MALDHQGQVIHQGQAGSANLLSTPERRLRSNLLQATRECPSADYICGCFAGLLTDEDRSRAQTYLQALYPAAKVHAEPDYAAAYFASEDGTDICVIAGTGSLVCSRINGRMVKSGGRGYLLGDIGSAYQVGRDALLHYLDRRKEATPNLEELIARVFNATEESEIVSHLYLKPSPPASLAKLAKAVGADAKEGLAYANAIIEKEMGLLSEVVVKHALTHFLYAKDLKITLAGGLWQIAPQFREAFTAKMQEKLSKMNLEVHRIVKPPVYGAVMLAKELAHVN